MGIFDLLEHAGQASGEEAVAKVAAKVIPPSVPKVRKPKPPKKGAKDQQPPEQDQQQQQQDQGGDYQPPRGRSNGRVFFNADGERFFDYTRSYDNGNSASYRGNYNGNVAGRGRGHNNGYSNGNRSYNNGYSNGNNQVYHENNGQYYSNNYGNGERQGYGRGNGQPRQEYRPKSKPASEAASDVDCKSEAGRVEEAASEVDQKSEVSVEPAASDADQKSEGNVEAAAEAPQSEATAAENADAVPASESEKSAGDVVNADAKKEGEATAAAANVVKKVKDPNVKGLSGSAKRKLKKKNPKKEDSNDGDASKKDTDNVSEVTEEPKKEMTLLEYEKELAKKKALVASKPMERKIDPAFEGIKPLQKKVEDDDRLKLENAQRKAKEVAAKEGKARKFTIQEYLKPDDGTEYVPPRLDGPQSGGGRGGRANNGFSGRSRDNSSRVYTGGDTHIVFHGVSANNGNGAPRRDGNQDRREGGYQQGGYRGSYQDRREGYNGGAAYQQGGNQERRQGGYQQGGYQERRQGGYQQGGCQERRQGGNQQGGYQERQQGGNQQGGQDRQQGGNQQGGYYGGRGNGGQGGGYRGGYNRRVSRFPPVPQLAEFPALGAAPAPSQASAPSPSQSQA